MSSARYILYDSDGVPFKLPPTTRPTGMVELGFNVDAFTPPFSSQATMFGDRREIISPVQLKCFMDLDTEEEAFQKFIELKIALKNAVRISRGTTWYRELTTPASSLLFLSKRHPEGLTSSMDIEFALLCKFPEWTRGVVDDLVDYLALAEEDKLLL